MQFFLCGRYDRKGKIVLAKSARQAAKRRRRVTFESINLYKGFLIVE